MTLDHKIALSTPLDDSGNNKLTRRQVHDRLRYALLTTTGHQKAPVFRLGINMSGDPYSMGLNMARSALVKSIRAVADLVESVSADEFMEFMDDSSTPQQIEDSSGFIKGALGTWRFDMSRLPEHMAPPSYPAVTIDGTPYSKEEEN